MSRPKTLPDDIKKSCLALVHGYERRRRSASSPIELQRVRAVEYAAENVGKDMREQDRQALLQAILISCINGRKYPFEKLEVDTMERTCFYKHRLNFLADIAKYMEML